MSRFVDGELARRLDECFAMRGVEYARAQRRIHPDWGADVMPVAGGFAAFAGPRAPVNYAKGLGMAGPVTDADMDAVEAFFARHGVPPGFDVCPFADDSLVVQIHSRGYALGEC